MKFSILTLSLFLASFCRANYRDWQSATCNGNAGDLVILQLSDLHIRHAADASWTREQLQKAVSLHKPHRIVLTGDLTANGKIDEWQALTQELSAFAGIVYIWGNHDMPLKEAVPENPGQTHFEDIGDVRLIYLDTAWPGPFVGSYTSLPAAEIEKLRRMADTGKRILVFGHHPVSEDAPHFVLKNAADIRAVFAVKRVIGMFTGHFHGAYLAAEGGAIYAGVAPFSDHQMNHTFSQKKGYRVIEVGKDCLRTTHQFVD